MSSVIELCREMDIMADDGMHQHDLQIRCAGVVQWDTGKVGTLRCPDTVYVFV